MADIQDQPEGLDDFLAADDPQAAIAAKGFQQLAQQPIVQKALDFGGNLDSYGQMVQGAMAGNEQAKAQLAQHSLGMAMGTIAPEAESVTDAIVAGKAARDYAKKPAFTPGEAGEAEAGPGAIQRLQEKKGLVDINQPGLTQKELNAAMQKANRPKRYADGGDVSAEPAGLDEFIKVDNSQPKVDSSIQSQTGTEPEGMDQFIAPELRAAKYGTPLQMAKASLEGAAQGVAGPLAPAAEMALGVKPEDIRGRAEENPVLHYGSEIAGLVAPALVSGGESLAARAAGFTQAGLLEKAGSALFEKGAEKAAIKSAEIATKLAETSGESLAAKIGLGAAKAAVDNMLLAGSDEVSRLVLRDPDQSAESAIASIGLAGALGGALGATGAGAMALWNKSSGSKAAQLVSDFRGRIQEHVNNPDPVSSMSEELGNYYKAINSAADEVYGPTGIKAQDIQKLMPEMTDKLNEKLMDHAQGVADTIGKSLKKMSERPNGYPERLVSKLQADLDNYSTAVSKENVKPGEVFNATQDLKQQLQSYAKYDKHVTPVDEAYDFVRDAKKLASDLRKSLEDEKLWGPAAKRQQVINKAFSEYLPTLKDFEKKFTTEVSGERQIDPAKISTYLNQVDNPKGEIKRAMLENFLDKSEKYKKVITDSHLNLGLDRPFTEVPLNITAASLKDKTAGSRLADIFISKGLTDAGSTALGASIGAAAGHTLGVGGTVGSLIGGMALSPFFKTILPSIAKSIVDNPTSARGLKAAVDYVGEVNKAQSLVTRLSKNVFKVGSEAITHQSSEKEREKLDRYVLEAQQHPEKIMNRDNHLQKYMPNHAQSTDRTLGGAIAYLSSLRPESRLFQAPLDSKMPPSAVAKAKYQQALNIAEKPLSVLNKIKNGTLTAQDMQHLQNLYPALYQNVKETLTNEMINHISKGEQLPYRTRVALSVFMGQPLDSTMMQHSIVSAQAANMQMGQAANQQGQMGIPKQSRGVKSAPALQKMPTLYQTPSQALSRRKLKE